MKWTSFFEIENKINYLFEMENSFKENFWENQLICSMYVDDRFIFNLNNSFFSSNVLSIRNEMSTLKERTIPIWSNLWSIIHFYFKSFRRKNIFQMILFNEICHYSSSVKKWNEEIEKMFIIIETFQLSSQLIFFEYKRYPIEMNTHFITYSSKIRSRTR